MISPFGPADPLAPDAQSPQPEQPPSAWERLKEYFGKLSPRAEAKAQPSIGGSSGSRGTPNTVSDAPSEPDNPPFTPTAPQIKY